MSTSFTFIDDLIRDYFQYRNLTLTSRLFDNEISKLPVGQYRADHIIEQLTVYIHQFDLNNFIDYWTQIEQRLLLTLSINSQQLINVFTKIRMNLYRCYLIHAVQTSKIDKINEFFERLMKILQQSNEWTKEWFILPFMKNPEENHFFQIYFSKQWNELFWISLQNFLSNAFYHMISPKICSIEEETGVDSLIGQFGKISSTEEQSQSNLTIISKLRDKFLKNNKQNPISTSDPLLIQPFQESTTEEVDTDTSLSNV